MKTVKNISKVEKKESLKKQGKNVTWKVCGISDTYILFLQKLHFYAPKHFFVSLVCFEF